MKIMEFLRLLLVLFFAINSLVFFLHCGDCCGKSIQWCYFFVGAVCLGGAGFLLTFYIENGKMPYIAKLFEKLKNLLSE